MGDVVPFPRKPKKTGKALSEAAQKAVEAGMSPMHPALSRIQRNNVVPLKKK